VQVALVLFLVVTSAGSFFFFLSAELMTDDGGDRIYNEVLGDVTDEAWDGEY
jgi:hypothetical protein